MSNELLSAATIDGTLQGLHTGLFERPTPQSVLVHLDGLGLLKQLPPQIAQRAYEIARHRSGASMSTSFAQHPGLERAYAAARRSLEHLTQQLDDSALQATLLELADTEVNPSDSVALHAWTHRSLLALGLTGEAGELRRPPSRIVHAPGSYPRRPRGARGARGAHQDLRTGFNSSQRREQLPGVSVRAYRDAVRALGHLATRATVFEKFQLTDQAITFAKSRLARSIAYTDFAADLPTAGFVAYYTARLGLRTLFTNKAQALPMDEVASALFDLAMSSPTVRPDVIARVITRQSVPARLAPRERLDLLGRHFEVMLSCARLLQGEFDPKRDRTRMVVRQGDDSSTWNAATRAFNQARTGWLNLLESLGMMELLETFCPGKAPALVAADVAAWHAFSGNAAHQDLAVFADLALPWDVVLGTEKCTLANVRAACRAHDIDPEATGWTQPFRQAGLAVAAPAPDLVHGITIAWPELAGPLRRAGFFSGQSY